MRIQILTKRPRLLKSQSKFQLKDDEYGILKYKQLDAKWHWFESPGVSIANEAHLYAEQSTGKDERGFSEKYKTWERLLVSDVGCDSQDHLKKKLAVVIVLTEK